MREREREERNSAGRNSEMAVGASRIRIIFIAWTVEISQALGGNFGAPCCKNVTCKYNFFFFSEKRFAKLLRKQYSANTGLIGLRPKFAMPRIR